MNSAAFYDIARTRGTPSPLQVVVFYEDVPAAQYAKRAVDLFSEQLKEKTRVKPTFWRLDIAHMPPLQSIVMNDLQTADLLVIAADNAADRAVFVLNAFLPSGCDRKTPNVLLIDLNEQTMHDIAAGHPECIRQITPTLNNKKNPSAWSLQSCG